VDVGGAGSRLEAYLGTRHPGRAPDADCARWCRKKNKYPAPPTRFFLPDLIGIQRVQILLAPIRTSRPAKSYSRNSQRTMDIYGLPPPCTDDSNPFALGHCETRPLQGCVPAAPDTAKLTCSKLIRTGLQDLLRPEWIRPTEQIPEVPNSPKSHRPATVRPCP